MSCSKNKMACGGKKSTGGTIKKINKFACGGKKKSCKRK